LLDVRPVGVPSLVVDDDRFSATGRDDPHPPSIADKSNRNRTRVEILTTFRIGRVPGFMNASA
jgi:hypothetical protein